MLHRCLQYRRPGDHGTQINNFEAVTLQHNANDILANVMHVALDGCHDDLALALGAGHFFCLNIREEMRNGLFHHAGGLHHLRQEHTP